MQSFYVQNFGCRATQADGAAIERQFRELGAKGARSAEAAEIVVLNTCTVTASADRDARAAIRRIHRASPSCKIVVTGCYAQRAPAEISRLEGVACVIGNSHKHELAELMLERKPPAVDASSTILESQARGFVPLSSLMNSSSADSASRGRIFVSDIFAHTELQAAPVFDGEYERTRPNLKVQDGCDNRCSFCVIPYVRGSSRSLALNVILREIRGLVIAGYQEVVISGINLGRWGRDFETPARFEDLIGEILDGSDLRKLRISSVEPMDWSSSLIRLMTESSRIAKHAHVPLQSGSDRILRLMHRKYRPWHYREKIEQIRAAMPTAAIGADVMVGFPGETDDDFEETCQLIEDLPLTYLHVFSYSARPGTPAALLKDQLPGVVVRERSQVLRELGRERKRAFIKTFLGTIVEAITLHGFDGKYTEALSDNFISLRLAGKHAANCWMEVRVTGAVDGALISHVRRAKAHCEQL
ncbi:MAG: tRNA (N(6)-L-threonylcarbamoyladenosine(37)-C(2))-methylthiotransferase MtaB [Acidobacteriaceae bacterium]